ncbi:14227_t:CDS:1, partial [Racocetra fulgida]
MIDRYLKDLQAGEKLAEWLIAKYKALNAIENSNNYNIIIQELKTILSKYQSIQYGQLRKEDVQWLYDRKEHMDSCIDNKLQNNFNLLNDEINQLGRDLEASSNDIKPNDYKIYQKSIQYLKCLHSGNDQLRNHNHLIEFVNSGVLHFINDELVKELVKEPYINEHKFDELKETINKLESNIDCLNNKRKEEESYLNNEFNKRYKSIFNKNFQNFLSEKVKLKDYIMNQYTNSKIHYNNDNNSEVYRVLKDFSNTELLNDIQILRKEKARLEDHLMKTNIEMILENLTQNKPKYNVFNKKKMPTQNEQFVSKINNNQAIKKDLIEIENKNDNTLDQLKQSKSQIEDLDNEVRKYDSIMKNVNSKRNETIQMLNDAISQKRRWGNYLKRKYLLLIEFENFNEESPNINKYRKNIENIEDMLLNNNDNIGNTFLFQPLYEEKERRKIYLTTQFKNIIEAFNDEKQKLENKLVYIKEIEKYQKLQGDIKSLRTEEAKWRSNLINQHIELENFMNNERSDSVINNERVQKLKNENQLNTFNFENPTPNNISRLINGCEQTIQKLEEGIKSLQAEQSYIVKKIRTLKVKIKCELMLKSHQQTQLEDLEKWTLIPNECLQKMEQFPGILNNNDASLNKTKGGNDRTQQLENEFFDLKGELEAKDSKIRELIDKNNSLKNEAVKSEKLKKEVSTLKDELE